MEGWAASEPQWLSSVHRQRCWIAAGGLIRTSATALALTRGLSGTTFSQIPRLSWESTTSRCVPIRLLLTSTTRKVSIQPKREEFNASPGMLFLCAGANLQNTMIFCCRIQARSGRMVAFPGGVEHHFDAQACVHVCTRTGQGDLLPEGSGLCRDGGLG
jgi:hypothetical protein